MDSPVPFEDISDEPLFNIKAVAQATGIEPVTLRAWERRYGVPEPKRAEHGYRLYSERDIAIVRWLLEKIEAGMTIKHAVSMLYAHAPQREAAGLPVIRRGAGTVANFEALIASLLEAASAFDTLRMQHAIAEAFALFTVEDACLHVLLPVLQQIGTQWRSGETSLQVEHFATNLIRQQLVSLMAATPAPTRSGRVVTGCVADDWHEMGMLMLSLFLRRQGWDVVYLGQAVGLERLEEALQRIQPDGVVLSASTFGTIANLPAAAEVVERTSNGSVWFAYGGALFSHLPGLVERIPGIYVGDSLPGAVQQIDGLLGRRLQPRPNAPFRTPDELEAARRAVRARSLAIEANLALLLEESGADLSPEAANETAHELVTAVLAALQFEMPELLDAPQTVASEPLRARGIGLDQIVAAFNGAIDARLAPVLAPYLRRL